MADDEDTERGKQSKTEEEAPPPEKPKAAKLSRLERAAQLRAKAARLEGAERNSERKRDTRQKVVIGGAVMAEARHNPAFRAQLAAIIKTRVTRALDVQAVADWDVSSSD